jgi:hypothetical protein
VDLIEKLLHYNRASGCCFPGRGVEFLVLVSDGADEGQGRRLSAERSYSRFCIPSSTVPPLPRSNSTAFTIHCRDAEANAVSGNSNDIELKQVSTSESPKSSEYVAQCISSN